MINWFIKNFRKTKLWKIIIKFLGGTRLFPNRKLKLIKMASINQISPYDECLKVIQKGDIILNNICDLLNNFVIPGDYGHIALYIGDNRVIDTRGLPVNYKELKKLFEADTLMILRPQVSDEYKNKMIEEAKKYIGVPYDYQFRFDLKTGIYCSELIYLCDVDKLLEIPVKKRFGVDSVSPGDFLESSKFKIIQKW